MEQFARWMKLEKHWMASYRKKMLRTTLLVTLPLTALVLGGLMAATSLMYDGFSQETVSLFLTGAAAGAFLVGLFILCLLPGLSAGRLKRGRAYGKHPGGRRHGLLLRRAAGQSVWDDQGAEGTHGIWFLNG